MAHVPADTHVLIVDDYVDALDIWAIYLQSIGYQVSTATDGLSAVALTEELLPDLVVLDLELPKLSGFDAAKRLRAGPQTRGIPLIAATGYSHARQLDRAHQVGFDAVVVKPCNPAVLVHEIERLLSGNGGGARRDSPGGEPPHNNG